MKKFLSLVLVLALAAFSAVSLAEEVPQLTPEEVADQEWYAVPAAYDEASDTMTLTLYDVVAVEESYLEGLKEGDTVELPETSVPVKTVKKEAYGDAWSYLVNEGLEEDNALFFYPLDGQPGYFRVVDAYDHFFYDTLGQVTLQLSPEFCFLDQSEGGPEEEIMSLKEDMLALLKEDAFTAENCRIYVDVDAQLFSLTYLYSVAN